MSRTIEVRPAARLEFDEAADWYEEQQQGTKAEFVQAVDIVLERVRTTPFAFPVVHGSKLRRALVDRFPYAVLFTVEDDLILVFAVFHTSRNPLIWRGRIG